MRLELELELELGVHGPRTRAARKGGCAQLPSGGGS